MSLCCDAGMGAGVYVREIAREGMTERFITSLGATPAKLPAVQECLAERAEAVVVGGEYFGPSLSGVEQDQAQTWLAQTATPLTWVQGGPGTERLGGLYAHGVTAACVTPLVLEGHVVGTAVEGPYATEVRLSGLYARDVTAPREVQARATFELMEEALALVGMDFGHVVRTWLFLDDILDWYGEFNHVRTTFFHERGVFDHLVPASTGIGGSNPAGAAMMTGVYAVRGKHPEVCAQAVPSPLQCPALEYGSSFSRAVEVAMPDLKRLLISGTASIEPGGRTEHVGEVLAQTGLTCEVVAAILESRGMGWEDVTRATAYVRHASDAGVFEEHRAASGMPPLPVIVAHNVICRDDLLFELEVDATQAVR